MPVDPEIKKLISKMVPYLPEKMDDVTPEEFRELSRSYRRFTADVPVTKVENLTISAGEVELKGRLYVDDEQSDALIIYYHGGGFVIGNLDSHDGICRMIAKHSRCKVISVDYRLAPEHRFPAAVDDAYRSYKWIRENASKFNVSADRIAVSGDSAGGNLCATLSLKAMDEDFPLPALNLMFYPIVSPDTSSESFREYSEGLYLTKDMMRWFNKYYTSSPMNVSDPLMSPLFSPLLDRMPETIVMTAEFDPLRDQGETYVSTLREKSVTVTGIRAIGMVHGFLGFFPISRSAENFLIMGASLAGRKLLNPKNQ